METYPESMDTDFDVNWIICSDKSRKPPGPAFTNMD